MRRRREICTSMERSIAEYSRPRARFISLSRESGSRGWLTSAFRTANSPLVSHTREPLSRDKLMNLARGREYSAMERSIDVQISRLRRMVEEDPAHPRYIQTVWGLGYVFVPDGSKA